MTETAAHRTVLIAAGLMTAAVLLQHRANPGSISVYRRLWAVGLLTLGLSAASDLAPQLTGPFAVLLIAAVAIRQRGELGALIGNPATSKARPSAGVQSTSRVESQRSQIPGTTIESRLRNYSR